MQDPRLLHPFAAPLKDYVVVDTETTGLNPTGGDRIIEIGAARVEDNGVADTFTTLVNPGRPINGFVRRLTGIDDSMLAAAPDLQTAMARFSDWLGGDVLVAHNAPFDIAFLDMAIREASHDAQRFLPHLYVDSLQMSRLLHPERSTHSVAALIRDYGIGDTEAHRALSDAMQEQQLYERFKAEGLTRGIFKGGCLGEKVAAVHKP